MSRAVEVRVSGEVQGVSFRWYAAQEAARLGVAGWIRNESDGSVLAHVQGPADAVEEMLTWCRHGSPAARVSDVAVQDVASIDASDFRVDH